MHFTLASIIAGIGPGLLAVGILVVNNLRDIEGDAKAGKRTLAVRFGTIFTRCEYTFCVFVGCTAAPLIGVLFYNGKPASLAGVCSVFSALPALRLVWAENGARLNPALGQTAKVLLFYSAMFSLGSLL
jgi:1,4-dihydroxy-2-naphthoate octaprenyltransferase